MTRQEAKSMEWLAKWVWIEPDAVSKNQYVEFRHVFETQEDLQASFHVSARNEYVLYLDGEYMGRGPSPCDKDFQYYDSYEGVHLSSGKHVIAAVCYHFGETDIVIDQLQGPPGFLLQLESEKQILLVSNEQWKCRISPRWSSKTSRISKWGGYNEIYLGDQEDGFESVLYDDSKWKSATVRSDAFGEGSQSPRLLPREIPRLYTELIRPKSIVRTDCNFGSIEAMEDASSYRVNASFPGSLPGIVLDFEREVVGRPVLTVQAPAGGVLRIAYGETMELQYVDTFLLKSGVNSLKPFGRRACRFMQLTFAATPEGVKLTDIQFELTHYPFQDQGTFQCSDSVLNRIWEVSAYTTLMNSHDHLEDCPWREKALWVVDAVVMGKVIYHVFGDVQLLRKCLLQGARIQNDDGSIPGTGPERNKFLLPDFCAYWLLGVGEFYRYSGDIKLIRELWPTIERLMEWFSLQIDETGLFAGADRQGWWCFIDWTEHVDRRDKVSAISMLMVKALRISSYLASEVGEAEASLRYSQKADELQSAIREHLWIAEKGLFADCMAGSVRSEQVSLQTNFLSSWCGILTEEETERFIQDYYVSKKLPAIKGAFFNHIVLEVLISAGKTGLALELIRSFWGRMLDRGATTWWETYDPDSPFCTVPSTYQGNTPSYLWEEAPVSLCHAWGSSPAYILQLIINGIDISMLGHGTIYVKEPTELVSSSSAKIPSPIGWIRISWERNGEFMTGELEVPEGLHVVKPPDYPLQVIKSRASHGPKK